MNRNDRLGENWLRDNDPTWVPTHDYEQARAIGLAADIEQEAHRSGGTLVGHGAQPSARTCVRCYEPFAPYKNGHEHCAECRPIVRREYMRDLMRQRRAA